MLYKLHSLVTFFGTDRRVTLVTLFLAEGGSLFNLVLSWSVEFLFEDGFLIDSLELGLEVVQGLGTAIGAASLVGEVIARVLLVVDVSAPTETGQPCL